MKITKMFRPESFGSLLMVIMFFFSVKKLTKNLENVYFHFFL